MKLFFNAFLFLLATSCATQKKTSVATRIFDLFEDYTKVISDAQIRRTAANRPELPENFKLAVYFKEADEKTKSPQDWKWTQKDKDLILNSIQSNKAKVGKVFELIDLGSEKDDAKALRLMAAQQGADGLLIIQGLSEVDTNANGLAFSYLALAPAFFVNGNEIEGTFVSQALLWNVHEPFVHVGVQNEGEYTHSRPLAFRQIPRVIRKSKEESLEGLSEKLQREFAQI